MPETVKIKHYGKTISMVAMEESAGNKFNTLTKRIIGEFSLKAERKPWMKYVYYMHVGLNHNCYCLPDVL